MVLHRGTDDVGDLVVLPVVGLEEGVEDAPLHRLEPVLDIRYRPVLDYIGGVVEEILVKKLLYVGHQIFLWKEGIKRFTTESTEGERGESTEKRNKTRERE
jgi:hypothetical protein